MLKSWNPIIENGETLKQSLRNYVLRSYVRGNATNANPKSIEALLNLFNNQTIPKPAEPKLLDYQPVSKNRTLAALNDVLKLPVLKNLIIPNYAKIQAVLTKEYVILQNFSPDYAADIFKKFVVSLTKQPETSFKSFVTAYNADVLAKDQQIILMASDVLKTKNYQKLTRENKIQFNNSLQLYLLSMKRYPKDIVKKVLKEYLVYLNDFGTMDFKAFCLSKNIVLK